MNATAWATFWVFLGFLVFLGILVYLKVPAKLAAALDARAAKIKSDLDDARRLREEAQALLAEYQRRRGEAEAEAEAIVDAGAAARPRRWPRKRAPASTITSPAAPRRSSSASPRPRRRRWPRCGAARSTSPRRPPRRILAEKAKGETGEELVDALDRGGPLEPELTSDERHRLRERAGLIGDERQLFLRLEAGGDAPEAAAVQAAGAELGQRRLVLLGRIALVRGEAVAGEGAVAARHQPVADDLRDDRGGGDRQAAARRRRRWRAPRRAGPAAATLPSTSTASAGAARPRTARRMATSVACRMLMRSIAVDRAEGEGDLRASRRASRKSPRARRRRAASNRRCPSGCASGRARRPRRPPGRRAARARPRRRRRRGETLAEELSLGPEVRTGGGTAGGRLGDGLGKGHAASRRIAALDTGAAGAVAIAERDGDECDAERSKPRSQPLARNGERCARPLHQELQLSTDRHRRREEVGAELPALGVEAEPLRRHLEAAADHPGIGAAAALAHAPFRIRSPCRRASDCITDITWL